MDKIPSAVPTGEIERSFDDERESEDKFFFHLQDSTHEFTMGLSDILKCVRAAENEGLLPPIPNSWWHEVTETYLEFRTHHIPPEDDR